MSEKWTEGVSLLVNAGPEDGLDHYDIWHTGGPGGPMLTAHSEASARAICDAIEELHQLRAENERLVQNAAARERVLNRQHDLLRKAERERDEAVRENARLRGTVPGPSYCSCGGEGTCALCSAHTRG
jgi:hypothetical protein